MPRRIALVACVSKKRAMRMRARDLCASDWFQKASTYASYVADRWYILSAKYGLVSPEAVIDPYDETLNRMPAAARRAWARDVLDDLSRELRRGDHVVPKVLWEYGVSDPQDPTWLLTDISWSTNPDDWEAARAELANIIEGSPGPSSRIYLPLLIKD